MPCYHPITAWKGGKTASGKRKLVFSPNGAVGLPIEIPCGQCIGCRLERARQWSVRLTHEAQFYVRCAFLTLTYSAEHLPQDGSLSVRDLQLFQKRVRVDLHRHGPRDLHGGPLRVRFFSVGEYGDQLQRPHYHALLFGWDFGDDRKPWTRGKGGEQIYVSETLDRLWGLGHAYIGSVTPASTAYVARYCVKKVNGDRKEAHYQGKQPEFMLCSKGIGRRWFEKFRGDLEDDSVVFKGKKLALPKFYDKLLGEEELAKRKVARRIRAGKHWRNQTPDRLAVREVVQQAKLNNLKREL